MATKGQKWAAGGCAVLVLALFGSCTSDDKPTDNSSESSKLVTARAPSATSAAATTAVPVANQGVWVGTVVDYPSTYVKPRIVVTVAGGKTEELELAHTARLNCRGRDELEAIDGRMHELAPIGSTVTIVRGTDPKFESPKGTPRFTDDVFIHLPAAGKTATTTPAGTSINETLLTEGAVEITNPEVNLSVLASKTVDEQLASSRPPLNGPNSQYWPTLLAAYRSAWDGRVNLQADCRGADDKAIVERDQRDELDRLRRGPDGQLGTADDDKNNYKFDDDGNVYIDVPVYTGGSSGGGFGGGGGRCRSRFC